MRVVRVFYVGETFEENGLSRTVKSTVRKDRDFYRVLFRSATGTHRVDICQHSVGISRSAGLERQYLTVRRKRGQAFPVCLDGTQFLQATTLTSVIGNDSPINRLPAKIVGNHDLLFITGKITIDRGQSGYANRIDRL